MATLSGDPIIAGGHIWNEASRHLERLFHSRSGPDLPYLGLGIAVILVANRLTWRYAVRYGVTAVHEVGHATSALLLTGERSSIRLRADTSGLTTSRTVGGLFRGALITMSGYPAPGLLAIGGAEAVSHTYTNTWFYALVGLGALAGVIWVRNVFGALVVAVWIGALVALSAWGHPSLRGLGAVVTVWLLAVGGVRAAAETIRRPAPGADTLMVARRTRMPLLIVDAGLGLFVVAEVVAVGILLVGRRIAG